MISAACVQLPLSELSEGTATAVSTYSVRDPLEPDAETIRSATAS